MPLLTSHQSTSSPVSDLMRSHATTPDSSPENTALRFVWEDRAAVITVAGVASFVEWRRSERERAAEPGPGCSDD